MQVKQFLENKPSYMEEDISKLMSGDGKLSDEKYKEIFLQTGLGKPAVNKLILNKDINRAKIYQTYLFHTNRVVEPKKVGIITYEDKMYDEEGGQIKHPDFVDLQKGDILISLNTQSLGWRHGHAGIVVDAEKGTVLEALMLGLNTTYQSISKWQMYPSVIQLRVKQNINIKAVINFAKKILYDIPYGLLSGLFKVDALQKLKTQCAHLVWCAYKAFGVDLNSDGGWLVTPLDILESKAVEIVQVLGIKPEFFDVVGKVAS